MEQFLFKKVDSINLALFRIIFGFLIACEGFGALMTGWVKRVLVTPEFTFNFIGFEFLQNLQGPFVYVLFVLLGIFGVMVMLGFRYRWSMLGYAIIWTVVYLMQKSSYNNHYYLLMLLSWIMVFLPANAALSIDAKQNPQISKKYVPRWVYLVLILQIWIVYTYGAIAKLYPDWWNGTAIKIFMSGKKNYWLIGEFLQKESVHIFMAYIGVYFDLLIVPLLLWKRTRLGAFIVSIVFHLSNSIIFQIGIFPYMSIAFGILFFSPEILRKRFLPKTNVYKSDEIEKPKYQTLFILVASIYFIFQIGLPLRHWFIPGDVFWTEEGHRMSWRMMLRARNGYMTLYVEDKKTNQRTSHDYASLLTDKQRAAVPRHADMIWQLAQKIKEIESEKGNDVAVYVDARVSVNGSPYYQFTDPSVDIASEKWSHFCPTDWIMPQPDVLKMKAER